MLEALGADPEAHDLKNLLFEGHGASPLKILPAYLADLIAVSREKISQNFSKICGEWFKDVPGSRRYIVSHGYSRTVLSVLRWYLQNESIEDHPRIFFILTEEEGSFDTRIMEYELKEGPDQTLRHFRKFAAGSEHHLLGLLKPGDATLILLGAECFDKDRRVVHARGIVNRLDKLVEELNGRGIVALVVVAAESYKHHDTSLAQDTNFYGQHFDRIDLYQPNSIHLIVTDEKEENLPPEWPNWREVVSECGFRRSRPPIPT